MQDNFEVRFSYFDSFGAIIQDFVDFEVIFSRF
jgi:hypothetical protein